jgi:hypothetical protein
MFGDSLKRKIFRAWRYLLIALVIFAIEEVIGGLKTFGIYSTPYLTHVIPAIILGLLITAVIVQTNVKRGWIE